MHMVALTTPAEKTLPTSALGRLDVPRPRCPRWRVNTAVPTNQSRYDHSGGCLRSVGPLTDERTDEHSCIDHSRWRRSQGRVYSVISASLARDDRDGGCIRSTRPHPAEETTRQHLHPADTTRPGRGDHVGECIRTCRLLAAEAGRLDDAPNDLAILVREDDAGRPN